MTAYSIQVALARQTGGRRRGLSCRRDAETTHPRCGFIHASHGFPGGQCPARSRVAAPDRLPALRSVCWGGWGPQNTPIGAVRAASAWRRGMLRRTAWCAAYRLMRGVPPDARRTAW